MTDEKKKTSSKLEPLRRGEGGGLTLSGQRPLRKTNLFWRRPLNEPYVKHFECVGSSPGVIVEHCMGLLTCLSTGTPWGLGR